MNLSRRKILSGLLATTAAAALTIPEPFSQMIVAIDMACWPDRCAESVWFLMDGKEPQMIQWTGVERITAWTTEDIRYSTVMVPSRYMMANQPSVALPSWMRK